MDIIQIYKERVRTYSSLEKECIEKSKRLPLYRLLSILSGIILFYVLLKINIYFSIVSAILAIIAFIAIVKIDIRNTATRIFYRNMKVINENEIQCINGKYNQYQSGESYKNPIHSYTSDLDIFGHFSLFQFISRGTFKISNDILADWLKSPASVSEIKERQEAIGEIRDKIDWRQRINAIGIKHNVMENDPQNLIEWMKESPVFLENKKLIYVVYILPILTIVSAVLPINHLPTLGLILIQFILANSNNNKVALVHQKVSRNAEILEAYSDLIGVIQKETFFSVKMQKILDQLHSNSGNAPETIKFLSRIVNRLDFRYNVFAHFFLNTLFFWDIHQILKLERWKSNNQINIENWFYSIGEIESLSGLANLSFNNPEWIFPQLEEEKYILKAKEIGHPLIKESDRVCNEINVSDTAQILLVTGSNMSGKSTYLRTIGVNMVLAMSGSVVCAKEFVISPQIPLTSMRIVDSLEENTSSFYAELKRLEMIIKRVENKERVFLLLDEILRGTNSNDRHIGSMALIKQLINDHAVGIIATHDIALSELSMELPSKIQNYNFDVQVENDELFFDYKLHLGVCKSMNASILMKKIGVKI